jgi:hypothetical protein
MLKFTALAVGLLSAMSIVPSAQALPLGNAPYQQTRDRDNRPQVVVSVNEPTRRDARYQSWEADRRRQLELVREREARSRWEAANPRHQYGRHRDSYNDRVRHNEYRRDR